MQQDQYEQLAGLARHQHGLIVRRDALEAGLSRHEIQHLVAAGRWGRVAPGVYAVNGTPDTWRSRVLAACLAAGPDALASHRTAAAVWGLEGFEPPDIVDLTVPRGRGPQVPETRLHRCRTFALAGGTTHDGIPVTGLARTLLDLAASERNPQIALRALDSARRRPHRIPWAALEECLAAHSRPGFRGVSTMRALLGLRHGTEPSDSHMEAVMFDLLVGAGLPRPALRHWVTVHGTRYRLDVAYPGPMVDIECDGKAHHLTEAAFEADAIRDAELTLASWLIIRVTWDRLRRHPEWVVDRVTEALRLRQAV